MSYTLKTSSGRHNYSQTEIPDNSEKSCQAPKRQNQEIQTDVCENKEQIIAKYDLGSLSSFLRRVTPTVCSVLEKNLKSKAFDRFKLMSDAEATSIARLHLLEKTLESGFCCSSVSWNCIGTALAVAYPLSY
ncbi:hypothetical protein JTE90_026694 [Oedothorax gibbosus]|uniref:Uncharacterized protein n=1 Tax=Oedothorax gibbosus TaxID=931172 RepID=A0AAV6V389_9ARAC|nr:hypothetical protein JTE90_026694 [Oedothorax gibbosus]